MLEIWWRREFEIDFYYRLDVFIEFVLRGEEIIKIVFDDSLCVIVKMIWLLYLVNKRKYFR